MSTGPAGGWHMLGAQGFRAHVHATCRSSLPCVVFGVPWAQLFARASSAGGPAAGL